MPHRPRPFCRPRPRRKVKPRCKKSRPRRGPLDDPNRRDQPRWRREASELIAAFEPETERDERLRRLLISIADFLEPGWAGRLGAEGTWGVFRALREIARASLEDEIDSGLVE